MKNLSGIWIINEMEMWDEDYFNMETQAYIKINKDKSGSFQFGLVSGYLYGDIYKSENNKERFEFIWEGNDESDEAFGYGWVKIKSKGRIEGEFRFHRGDNSKFLATKKGFDGLAIFDIKNRKKRIATIIKDDSMPVNSETLKNYLDFLKENIELPYNVTGIGSYFTYSDYKGKTPNGNDNFEIIEFEEDVENCSNLFVKVKRLSDEGGIFSLQLFEFKSVDKKSTENKILKDYTYWIEHYL